MKPYEKFLHDRVGLRHLLEVYLELRQHFQEIGFSESDLEQPPTYTDKMMTLFHKYDDTQQALFRQVNDFGFDVKWNEFGNFIFYKSINQKPTLVRGYNLICCCVKIEYSSIQLYNILH